MKLTSFLLVLIICRVAVGQTLQPTANDSALEKFKPLPAPKASGLLLKKGDRVAICGDSITEQKMYSRIIEDYLTMCLPELGISAGNMAGAENARPAFWHG